jgi:hypothetical protein
MPCFNTCECLRIALPAAHAQVFEFEEASLYSVGYTRTVWHYRAGGDDVCSHVGSPFAVLAQSQCSSVVTLLPNMRAHRRTFLSYLVDEPGGRTYQLHMCHS